MVAEPMTTMRKIMNTESAKAERRAKQRKGAWTAARRKKFSATMAAKRAGQPPSHVNEIAALVEQGMNHRAIARQLGLKEWNVRTRIDWLKKYGTAIANRTMTIPAEAIPPRRETPVRRYKRRELPVTGSAATRAMRVVVKAGSEITVTIGGVEVQIVAEER